MYVLMAQAQTPEVSEVGPGGIEPPPSPYQSDILPLKYGPIESAFPVDTSGFEPGFRHAIAVCSRYTNDPGVSAFVSRPDVAEWAKQDSNL